MDVTDQPKAPFRIRRRVLAGCDVAMAVAAASAVSALAMEYGFYAPPAPLGALRGIQQAVLAVFVLERLLRLALAQRRLEHLKENWIDLALIAGVVAAAAYYRFWLRREGHMFISVAGVYVVIMQVYILAVLAVRTAGLNVKLAGSGLHPIWILIGSFVVVILFGTGLLMLPKALPPDAPEAISFTDALFTSTSATCVTGLIVRDTGSQFAAFGQSVILGLIQVGGLGIMVFGTIFALMAGRTLSVRESLLAGAALPDAMVGRIGRMVGFAILTAVVLEAAGAAAMYPMWADYAPHATARATAFRSAFHSISAFCNAGFSLQASSLSDEAIRGRWQTLGVIAPLIFLGGLGFPVLYDVARAARGAALRVAGRTAPALRAFTLHSRLVLTMSAALLVVGAAGLWGIERASDPGQTFGARHVAGDALGAMPRGTAVTALPTAEEQVSAVVFQSVTARTAGFNTVDMNGLTTGGKLWMCLLMIVGGSPASTAGGMKTTTLAVLLLTVWSMLRRRQQVEGFRRTIAWQFIRRALTLAVLYVALLTVVTLLLCVSLSGTRVGEHETSFMQILFEACSACGTVGLSCGVTGVLTTFGKYVIIVAMFAGRLGPLTVLLAMTVRLKPARYAYPGEEVILG